MLNRLIVSVIACLGLMGLSPANRSIISDNNQAYNYNAPAYAKQNSTVQPYWGNAPQVACSFALSQCWEQGIGIVPIAYEMTITRALGETCEGSDKNYAPITYQASNNAVCTSDLGLQIYGAETNLALQSNNFSNASWNIAAATVVGTPTAPDGTATAVNLTDNSSNAGHRLLQTLTKAASALPYVETVYARIPTGSTLTRVFLEISDTSTGAVSASFDLAGNQVGVLNGNVGGFTNSAASIQRVTPACGSVANCGWYRLVLSGTTTATTGLDVRIYTDNGTGTGASSTTYVGSGNAITIWEADLKQEAVAALGPPIPTTTVAITRPALQLTAAHGLKRVLESSSGRLKLSPNGVNGGVAATLLGVSGGTVGLGFSSSNHLTAAWGDSLTNATPTCGGTFIFDVSSRCDTVIAWNAQGSGIFTGWVSNSMPADIGPTAVAATTTENIGSLTTNSAYCNCYIQYLSAWSIRSDQPLVAAAYGYDREVYSTDFSSLSTIDTAQTFNPGFLLYLPNGWPDAGCACGNWTAFPGGNSAVGNVSVATNILTISKMKGLSQSGLYTAGPASNTVGYVGFMTAPGGAYFETAMQFDPSLSSTGAQSFAWPITWAVGADLIIGNKSYKNPSPNAGNPFLWNELDFDECFPGSGSCSQWDHVTWVWNTTTQWAVNLGSLHMTPSPVSGTYNVSGVGWVPTFTNNGRGIMGEYLSSSNTGLGSGAHRTADDFAYFTNAAPSVTPTCLNEGTACPTGGAFQTAISGYYSKALDTDQIAGTIGTGCSGASCNSNWPATFKYYKIWQ